MKYLSVLACFTCALQILLIGFERQVCTAQSLNADLSAAVEPIQVPAQQSDSKPAAFGVTRFALNDFSEVGGSRLWAVGRARPEPSKEQNLLITSEDGGRTWRRQWGGSQEWYYRVRFINSQVGWMVGYEGLVLKSTDGGNSWSKRRTPTDEALLSCQFIDEEYGWAMSDNGVILRTTNGGLNWQAQHLPVQGSLNALHFVTRSIGWAVGDQGEAFRSSDGGATWRSYGATLQTFLPKQASKEVEFRAVKFLDAKVGFIAATVYPKEEGSLIHRSLLLKTVNSGSTWTVMILSDQADFSALQVLNEKEIWAVLAPGFDYMQTSDGGRTWTTIEPTTEGGSIKGLHFANSQNGWLIVTHGTYLDQILYTTDGGKLWAKAKLPE